MMDTNIAWLKGVALPASPSASFEPQPYAYRVCPLSGQV